MSEVTITGGNFEDEVMKSDKPVLLDFWAEWCGPCIMLSSVVSEISEKYEGKIKVGKVNVDDEPELADAFGVSNIPLLVVLEDGIVKNSAVGYRPPEQVEALLYSVIHPE